MSNSDNDKMVCDKTHRGSLTRIRHEVSTAVGHIESAYENLKEEPNSEFADRLFHLGIARLQKLIRQLDSETNQNDEKPTGSNL